MTLYTDEKERFVLNKKITAFDVEKQNRKRITTPSKLRIQQYVRTNEKEEHNVGTYKIIEIF